jgi:hypothetical protein
MVCAIVKSSGSLCELHKKDDASLEGCDVCFEIPKARLT